MLLKQYVTYQNATIRSVSNSYTRTSLAGDYHEIRKDS